MTPKPGLWFKCDVCGAIIAHKVSEKHAKVCPIVDAGAGVHATDYIRDAALYTRSMKWERGVQRAMHRYDTNAIYMTEEVARLLKAGSGDQLAIEVIGTGETLVRTLALCRSSHELTTVCVKRIDYQLNWAQHAKRTLKITAIPTDVIKLASRLELRLLEPAPETCTDKQLEHARCWLRATCRHLVFCEQSIFRWEFFQTVYIFAVNRVEKSENIDEMLQQLELDNDKASDKSFFQFGDQTAIEFFAANNKPLRTKAELAASTFWATKADIGGLDRQIALTEDAVLTALGYRAEFPGLTTTRCILLHGVSGSGKSMLCEALCAYVHDLSKASHASHKTHTVRLNISELFSRTIGQTEQNLNEYFVQARERYPAATLIVVEDLHLMCPRNNCNDLRRRLSVEFCRRLTELVSQPKLARTCILGTTAELEALNPRILSSVLEVELDLPSPLGRVAILTRLLSKRRHTLEPDDMELVAQTTHGYTGADLQKLLLLAARKAQTITTADISDVLCTFRPPALRQVVVEQPNVRWSDIGGQAAVRRQIEQMIKLPLVAPEKFARFKLKPARGILLYGPPGCSKTMIAKAVASEIDVNFLSLRCADIFSMWVGESERAIRDAFRKARQIAPAIIFLDELDAVGSKREANSGVKERVLTQLLTELDGVEALPNVILIAATNLPNMIDDALMRPGRIDRIVYVGLPDSEARREILSIKLSRMPVGEDVDVAALAALTDGYSGAEIIAVCEAAALDMLDHSTAPNSDLVCSSNFSTALEKVRPRTKPELLQLYEDYRMRAHN